MLDITGPLSDPDAEVSGMAWKGDTLVVLPQFPTRFGGDGELGFFSIDRAQISSAMELGRSGPIVPRQVTCNAPGLEQMVRGFDGLEAIALLGDRFFLTVEAGEGREMAGYLLSARFEAEGGHVSIDTARFCEIPFALSIPNFADETIVALQNEVFTMGEANGVNVNPEPRAKRFSPDLEFLGCFALPAIEYRVTDATAVDGDGRFWVINYFWPPEGDKLNPAPDEEPWPLDSDPLAADARRSDGPSDVSEENRGQEGGDGERCIERLLELRVVQSAGGEGYIERTSTPPIYLVPQDDGECRNWEAVVRLGDDGFLVMTDRFPTTLLAFVPNPYFQE